MNRPAREAKRKPDHRQYVVIQFFSNLIGVVIVVGLLAWIVFGLFGPGEGTLIEVRAFMLLFLVCFVLIQCHGAVINTRRDLVRGRWVMESPAGREPDRVFNPWKRIGPAALPAGIATALAVWFLLPLAGGASFKLLTINAIAFVPLLLVSTALIAVILPADQVSFARALDGKTLDPVPAFPAYFAFEHILPWAVIQGLINLGIGVKQFKWVLQGPEPAGAISPSLVGTDFGIVSGILFFFMFISSDGQVRGDVRLGRVTRKHFKRARVGRVGVPLIAVGLVLTTVAVMAAATLVMQILFSVAGLHSFPVPFAVALKTGSAMLGSLAGCGLGVWWGRRRESAMMSEHEG